MKYDVRFIVWCTTIEYNVDVFVLPVKGDKIVLYGKTYKVIERTLNLDNGEIIIYIGEYGDC